MKIDPIHSKGDAIDAVQRFLKEGTDRAEALEKHYGRIALLRRIPAYLIKGIAIFGGLFVAVAPTQYAAPAGIAVTVSVLIDQWLSNFKRMIVYSVANKAIKRTRQRIADEYNYQIVPIVELNNNGESTKARQLLIDLARQSLLVLNRELDRVVTAVDQADIEFLSALNVDQPAKPTQTHLPAPTVPEQLPPA